RRRPTRRAAPLGGHREPGGAHRRRGADRPGGAGSAATGMSYQVAHLDELERIPVAHGLEWRPIRRRFGIAAFGVNAYTAEKPGDWIVEEHTEESLGHEELYLVVGGGARFSLGGEVIDEQAGDRVFRLKRV